MITRFIFLILFLLSPANAAPPIVGGGEGAKLLAPLMMKEVTTPSTPETGYQKLYFNSVDGKLYKIDDAGVSTEVGAIGSVTDTNSVDLTLSSGALTADLILSAAAADVGFINATNTIESDGLQVQIPIADTDTTGVLSDTDWDTFNGKQDALTTGNLTGTNISVTGGTGAVIGSGVSISIPQSVATGATPTFAGMTLGADGLDVSPGSDIDSDLITVNVTGTPTQSWDETNDRFKFSKGINILGDFTLTGTVDGRDIATDGANLDNLTTTIGLSALTSSEVDQLENIGTEEISPTEWGYLAALDQALTTLSDVVFNTVKVASSFVLSELSSTPSTPSSGEKKLYCKDDGQCYTLDSAGTEKILGSGTGSSDTNHIENGNAEFDLTGWDTYSDGTAAPISCGTSASGSSVLTRSTSTPLRKPASFVTTSTTVGDGYVYEFTIDESDKNTIQHLNIQHQFLSAGSLGDWSIWVCDADTDTLIKVQGGYENGDDAKGQNIPPDTGVNARSTLWFNATSSLNYRLLVHHGSGNGIELKFDEVEVGPGGIQTGPFDAYLGELTTTGSWSANTTYSGKYWREGDKLKAKVRIAVSGAPTSAALTVNLPSGYTIDTAKLPSTSPEQPLGRAEIEDANDVPFTGSVFYSSTTAVAVKYISNNDGSVRGVFNTNVTQAAPMTFASGDFVEIEYEVPISGWSVSASLSTNEILVSTVSAFATGDPASATSGNPIIFPTESDDVFNAYNNSTGLFTVPKSGKVCVNGFLGSVTSTGYTLFLYRDGSSFAQIGANAGSNGPTPFTGCVKVTAGQTVSIRPNATVDAGAGNISFYMIPDFSSIGNIPTVTSQKNAAEKIVRAKLECDGGSQILSQVGSWVSAVGNISSGECTVTLATGIFSATPTCTVSPTGSDRVMWINPTSATNISIDCLFASSGSACTDHTSNVICMGPMGSN